MPYHNVLWIDGVGGGGPGGGRGFVQNVFSRIEPKWKSECTKFDSELSILSLGIF